MVSLPSLISLGSSGSIPDRHIVFLVLWRKSMKPNDYQDRALSKEADQYEIHLYVAESSPEAATRFTNGLVGLVDEVGELSALRKRWLEYQQGVPKQEDVLEECGDVIWRVSQILRAFDLTLEQAMRANLAKLEKVRYKDNKCNPIEAAEENRNREAEMNEVRRAMAEDDGVCYEE